MSQINWTQMVLGSPPILWIHSLADLKKIEKKLPGQNWQESLGKICIECFNSSGVGAGMYPVFAVYQRLA